MAARLKRVLGPLDATSVVIGAIIGVGIFFTPNRVAALAGSGPLALWTWAIGGGIALLGALTFAELGGLYPRSGGQYDMLRDAWGPLAAFLFVFCNATAIQAGATAIIAVICAEHLGIAAGGVLEGPALIGLAAALILGLVAANSAGVRWGAGIQNLTVIAKVATLLTVTVLAACLGTAAPGRVASHAGVAAGVAGAIFAGLVPALFSFGGWQHALWMAGEVRRPHRNVPRAIIGGVLVVVIVYLLVNWAYLRLLGFDGVAAAGDTVEARAVAARAVGAVWPGAGKRFVALAIAVSAFGVLNAQLLAGPRLVYGMACDGRFFKPFAGLNTRFGTPVPAIALIGGLALALLLAAGKDRVDRLLTGVVFIDAIFFVLTAAALPVLRRRRPAARRLVRVPLYPFVPLLFIAGELCVIAGAALDPGVRGAACIGLAWIVAGTVCYMVFFRKTRAKQLIGVVLAGTMLVAAAGCVSEQSVEPGINDRWKSDEIGPLIASLESESREIYANRALLAAVAGAEPGMDVADVGAGSGFMARAFAGLVGPAGTVYAVDINAAMMQHVALRAAEDGITNLRTVVCTDRSANLAPGSVDLVFICDTYHHFEYPRSTMQSIREALRPGGRLVVVDFRREPGVSRPWVIDHVRAGQEVVVEEITAAGFELTGVLDVPELEENYVLRFRRIP